MLAMAATECVAIMDVEAKLVKARRIGGGVSCLLVA